MARQFVIAALVLLLLNSRLAAEDATQTELKKFTGTWQLISAVKDGKETPAEQVKKIRVVIENGKHSVYFDTTEVTKEIPFEVDPTQMPKTTVDTLPDGQTIKGIYKLDGDMLTSCVAEVGADRPKEFAAKPGSGHTLRTFKRVPAK